MNVTLTARAGGMYRLYVDGDEESQHQQEREAVEAALKVLRERPGATIEYDHDYRVRVEAPGREEPEPEPEEPPVEEPENPAPDLDDEEDNPSEWFGGRYDLRMEASPGDWSESGVFDNDAGTVTLPRFGTVAAQAVVTGKGAVRIDFELPSYGPGAIYLYHSVAEDSGEEWLAGRAELAEMDVRVVAYPEGSPPVVEEPPPDPVLPDAPPPIEGESWRANEPRGFRRVAERAFSALDEPGFYRETRRPHDPLAAKFSVVRSEDAPISPPTAGRVTFPRGHTGSGSSSYNTHVGVRVGSPRSVYLAFSLRVSPNWYGHTGASANKVLYIGQTVMFVLMGSRGAALRPRLATQGNENRNCDWDSPENRVRPSLADVEFVRGQYRLCEILVESGTPGQADGALHMWIDGKKTHEFVDHRIFRASNDQYGSFGSIRWHPIYGGQNGEDVPAEQWQEIDHLYLSVLD